jgi:ribosome maturation factor RimP
MGASRPFFMMRTTTHEKERELTEAVSETVASRLAGVEVLAVEFSGPEHFTVFVDHDGGVDLDLCQRVTHVLRDYLRTYQVDVSSPGIERPLRKPEHFRRVIGRRVRLRTPERRRFRGEVVAAGERSVTVRAGGEDVEIPYEEIVRGNLIEEEVPR